MEDRFKIYIDRLKKGHTEDIQESFDPSFLEVAEKDLKFIKPVKVDGHVYIAENDLVINISIDTEATLPCSVCNQETQVPISIKELIHLEPLDEIKGQIYDLRSIIREAVLLEVPFVVECSNGKCPERANIQKFLADPTKREKDEGYKPFKDL